LGTASYSPELGKVWRDIAVVLNYDYLSCDLVGRDVHGNRMDFCEGFGIANYARNFWCLCGSRLATLVITRLD
jgi:hypothetical protein